MDRNYSTKAPGPVAASNSKPPVRPKFARAIRLRSNRSVPDIFQKSCTLIVAASVNRARAVAISGTNQPAIRQSEATKCSETGGQVFECLTDADTAEAAWVPVECAGTDECGYNEDLDKFECCTPDCSDKECGTPSDCMLSCGTCQDTRHRDGNRR